MEKEKILVVEDEMIIAEDIRKILVDLGYVVPEIITTGEEAIKKTEEIRPDLVLMDINLKGNIDGIESAQEIHNRFDIPIIYVSAYSNKDTLERARKTEPFGYIPKPFTDIELNAMLTLTFLNHRILRRSQESEKWQASTSEEITLL